MAFVLKACLSNPCSVSGLRFEYTDTSGTYDVTTNPTGYGVPAGPTSPSSFGSYMISVWFPHTDTGGPASQVIDLLAIGVPTPDANGFYTWSFGPSDLGLTNIVSGTWYAYAVAQFSSDPDYIASAGANFYTDIQQQLDAAMATVDITCACKAGCEDVVQLYSLFAAIVCGGECSAEKFQKSVDYLYSKTPNCC